MADGMVSTIAITKAAATTTTGPGAATSVREYRLCLEEIDELTAMIFKIRGYNPTPYLPRLKEEARQYIYKENTAFSA